MNNSVQLIQSFNKDGMLLFVNKSWKDTFGYSDQEIQSINLFDIIAEEDKAHCAEIFENILKGVPAFEIKATFISKLGVKILLKGNILPMLNNGELVATHAFFNDISELSVVKKELASKDVLLETIFKSIPLCLYLKDYDGKYVFANDMMMQTIGWDVIGKTDHDIFDEESAELLKQKDQEAIAFEHQNNKFTFINEIKGEKKHFYCGKKSISTENQKKLIFGYTVDITELRNKAAKVEESERILNQIVSNTNSGIMLFKLDNSDNSYKIDYINNTCQKIINYNGSKTELTALLPDLQLDTQFAAENGALISQVYEYASNLSGASHYYDVFINRIDITDHDHKLLVLFNDVTEKRNMIDKLELKLKENVLLLSEVHHRVKNNLEVISSLLELQSEGIIDDVAKVVGMSAVKYADLSQNRTSNYVFSFDKMLSLQGNTAPYLLYAYVRIQGIRRKGEIDFKQVGTEAKMQHQEEAELTLAKHLLQLNEVIEAVATDLLPNRLCQYLFELSQKFNQF
jgi:PAS domain S-box-containing protein